MAKSKLPSIDDTPGDVATIDKKPEPAPEPKAKQVQPPAPPSSEHIDDQAEDHDFQLQSADRFLMELKLADRPPTRAEYVYFLRELGWDEVEVRTQLRRIGSVLRHKAIAGSVADREAAIVEAEKAAAAHKKHSEKLEAEIKKLTSQLRVLEDDKRLSQQRVDQQAAAVQALRDIAPDHIKQKHNQLKREAKETIGKELSDKKIRLNEIECCLDRNRFPDVHAYFECVKRSYPEAIEYQELWPDRLQFTKAWPEIKERIEAELDELRPEVEQLEAELAEKLEAAQSELDWYATE